MTSREYRKNIYGRDIDGQNLGKLLYPQNIFGSYVGETIEENYYKTLFTVLFILIIAILSTITFNNVREDNNITTHILISIVSISWFVFISFLFNLFSALKLLHICMFIALVTLSALTLKNLEGHNKDMMIAVLVFSGLGLAILNYYFILSRTRSDVQSLRKEAFLRKQEEKINERIEKAKDEAIKEEIKKIEKSKGETAEFKKELIAMYSDHLAKNQPFNRGQRNFQRRATQPFNKRFRKEEIEEEE